MKRVDEIAQEGHTDNVCPSLSNLRQITTCNFRIYQQIECHFAGCRDSDLSRRKTTPFGNYSIKLLDKNCVDYNPKGFLFSFFRTACARWLIWSVCERDNPVIRWLCLAESVMQQCGARLSVCMSDSLAYST